jgi:endonuclease G
MIGVTAVALILLWNKTQRVSTFSPGNSVIRSYEKPAIEYRNYLPDGMEGELVHHQYFSLAYSEEDEQAFWVAYRLDKKMLEGRRYPRTDWFEEDPAVGTGSASYEDYRGSGYTKGHLVPAADMAFSPEAMEETFLMSNISPQTALFNQGIWRELEEQTRDWARSFGALYIISGPVLSERKIDKVGRAEVTVPPAYFKVLLDLEEAGQKGIAFVIPNSRSDRPLMEYAVTIDSVEQLTSLDFFSDMDLEDELFEAAFDPSNWPVKNVRFQRRIKDWNQRR